MAPQALVFDMDGTLVDTEHLWDEVRRGLAAEAGIDWREEYTVAMMGMSTPEWSHFLVEKVGLPMSPEEAARATVQGMVDHYQAGIDVMDGAVEAVRRMASRYPVGIASSSPRLLIETAAEVLGITELLSATVSTEEVSRGKPSPDGYLRACELLGALPGRSVAVEDSTNGILAALNAGMSVVSVPQLMHPADDDAVARTTHITKLDELTFELVEGLV